MYPVVETTHVLIITVFFGLTAFWDLRLLGMALGRVPVSDVGSRLLPWAVGGFVLSVVTGVLLIYSSPIRVTHNIFFRVKILLVILAGLNILLFRTGIYRRVAQWDLARIAPRQARMAGVWSLLLWAGVVISGRMIAYDWFDYHKPEQITLVRFLSGCLADSP